MNLDKILNDLSISRPVFHSEADLQHSLAWEIHKQNPDFEIRFEFKPRNLKARIFVDLWIKDENNIEHAIELKYKTKSSHIDLDTEEYDLLNQGAQDLGRYDFLKDLQRIESIASVTPEVMGHAILLTNDSSYWNSSSTFTIDQSFRLSENRIVTGELMWHGASEGTMKGRKNPVLINGEYELKWKDYSRLSNNNGRFRYLLIELNS